jgi:hypothetical protein
MSPEQARLAAASLRDNEFLQEALQRMRADSLEKLAAINFVDHPELARDLQANVRVIDGIYLAVELALAQPRATTGVA